MVMELGPVSVINGVNARFVECGRDVVVVFCSCDFYGNQRGLVSSNCLCRYGTIISCYYNKTRERNGADGLVTLLDRPWTSSRM